MPRQPHHMMGSNWPFVPDENDPNFDPIEDGLNRAGRSMRLRPTEPEPFSEPFIRTPFDPEEILLPQGSAFAWDNVRLRMEKQAGNVQPPPDPQDDGTEKIGAASPIVGGVPQSNDIQSFAARTAALNEARKGDAPFVRTFARGNGRLGAVAVAQAIPSGGATRQSVVWSPCVRWVSQDPEGADPQPITVALSSIVQPGQSSVGVTRPFAWIRFGTQAGLQSMYVDCAPGQIFTLNATSVDVQVGQASVGSSLAGTALNAQVTAMLGFGSAAKGRPAHFTSYWDPAFGGGTLFNFTQNGDAIPPMAESLYIIRTTPNANDITVSFSDGAGNPAGSVTIPVGQYQQQPIQVPPDAATYSVSTTGPNGCVCKVIWSLGV